MRAKLPYVFYATGSAAFIAMAIMAFVLWNTTKQVERHLATLSEPADHIPLTIPEHFNGPTSQADQPMVEIDPTKPPMLKPLPSVATTLSPQVQPTEQQPTPNFGHSDLTKARTGHLPPSIAQGTLKRDPAAARIIGPDEFGDLATRLRKNPFKVKAEYGDRRILISNWWDALRGISQPQLVWSNQNRCTLEEESAELAANADLPTNQEILVSGSIVFEYSGPGGFLMRQCRIHGFYDDQSGYYPALSGTEQNHSSQ